MKKLIVCAAILVCSATPAFPQQATTATLSGRVTDSAGAVIAGVKVTVTQKATSANRMTTTNSEGLYVLTSLPPGEYDFVFEQTGFKKSFFQSSTLQVGQVLTVDLKMEPGLINEHSQTTEDPLVNTSTSLVDGVIKSREISNLPLNGRNYLELAMLIPGNYPF